MRTSTLVFVLILVLGLTWIFITDILVANVLAGKGIDDITYWQMVKGSLFVLIMGLVAFGVIRLKERQIDQSDKVFLRLFHHNPNPMWIYDVQSLSFLAVNKAAVENYGYSEQEFHHMTILDIRPEEDKEMLRAYLATPSEKRDMDHIWAHLTRTGKVKQIKTAAFDVLYEGQKGRLVTITDLTQLYEEQQAEIDRLRQEKLMKQQLETLINSTDDIMWSIDDQKRFLLFNRNFSKWYQRLYGKELVVGDFVFSDTFERGEQDWWNERYEKALAGEDVNVTQKFELSPDEALFVEFDFLPIIVDQQVIGAACFGKDITFYLKTIDDLQKKNDGLNDIAFIGAHELRKPVANLLGLLPLATRRNDPRQYPGMLKMMEDSAKELDTYIRKMIQKVEEIGAQGDLDQLSRRFQSPGD